MLQSSDELNYLNAVQLSALDLTADRAVRRCISPPDGNATELTYVGGKRGFQAVTGAMLVAVCSAGAGDRAFYVLRLILAMSLPVVVLATWILARSTFPHDALITLGAPSLVALNPVLAKYGAAVGPDGVANAAGALAMASAARLVMGGGAWHWVSLVLASTVAFAWKDNTWFLLPVMAATLSVVCWYASPRGRRIGGVTAATLLVLALATVLLLPASLEWFTSPYPLAADVEVRRLHLVEGIGTIVALAIGQMDAYVWTGWSSLGNFGASTLTLPIGWRPVVFVGAGAAVIGVLRLLTVGPPDGGDSTWRRRRAAVILLGMAVAASALQAPTRTWLLQSQFDTYQGRWLFPSASALAILTVGGWSALGASQRCLPLLVLGLAMLTGSAFVVLVSHYYLDFPGVLDMSNLYLASTGGHEVPREHAVRLIVRPEVLREPLTLWVVVGVLAAAVASSCTLVVAEATRVTQGRDPLWWRKYRHAMGEADH
jgi:hypothetical protein